MISRKVAVGIPNSKEYLKTQIVTGNQSVNYSGEPLQPGNTYRLSIFLSEFESASPTMFVPFKILEAPQRNRITAELRAFRKIAEKQRCRKYRCYQSQILRRKRIMVGCITASVFHSESLTRIVADNRGYS